MGTRKRKVKIRKLRVKFKGKLSEETKEKVCTKLLQKQDAETGTCNTKLIDAKPATTLPLQRGRRNLEEMTEMEAVSTFDPDYQWTASTDEDIQDAIKEVDSSLVIEGSVTQTEEDGEVDEIIDPTTPGTPSTSSPETSPESSPGDLTSGGVMASAMTCTALAVMIAMMLA